MKEFDLIIKNGTVVTSTESFLCDVAVKDGKIDCGIGSRHRAGGRESH